MSFKPLHTIIVVFCALVFLFFSSASETLAANIYLPPNQSPPSQTCTITGGCDSAPTTCWNSQSAGVTDCGTACDGGSAWTKYNLIGCRQSDQFTCNNYYQASLEVVCSTADKCTSTSSNPYLNSGFCNCTTGGVYKTCCTNSSPSVVAGNSCVQVAVDETNPPWEGVCPAGSTAKFCGFGGYPACGQSACGEVAPPPPPPPPPTGGGAPSTPIFSGDSCSANLSWSGDPLPSSDPACPNGFWVDIDTDSSFSGGAYHKCVTDTFTTAPSGFNGFNGSSGELTFQAGTTYYARVFNGTHSGTASLTPAACSVPPQPQGPPDLPVILVATNTRTNTTIGHVDTTRTDNTTINAQTGDTLRLTLQGKNRLSTQESSIDLVYNLPAGVTVTEVDFPCIESGSQVSCGQFSVDGFSYRDEYQISVRVGSSADFTISSGQLVRSNRYTNPTYAATDRKPSNNWRLGQGPTNQQSDFFGTFYFDSNSVNVNLPQAQCPAVTAPTNLSPTGPINNYCGSEIINLSWTGTAGATYNVRVDDGNNATQTISGPKANDCLAHDVCINNWNSTSMNVIAAPDKSYSFWVHTNLTCQATGTTSTSSPSQTANFNTVCTQPNSLSVPNYDRPNINQSWPQKTIAVKISNPPGKVGWRAGNSSFTPGPCTDQRCVGWTDVKSNVSGDFSDWEPPQSTADGTYTFALFKQAGAEVTELLAVDTAIFTSGTTTTPTPPTTGGATCEPDTDGYTCTTTILPNCSLQAGEKTAWCQQFTNNSNAKCQYCTSSPPASSSCSDPPTPVNNTPTATLRADGHTVDIVYQYQVEEAGGAPRGTITVANKPGFAASGGTEIGNQFGSHPLSFDTNTNSSSKQLYYYQLKTVSDKRTGYSNTYGVVTRAQRSNNCAESRPVSVPNLVRTENIQAADTTVTFDLIYTVGATFGDCDSGPCRATYYPSHLLFQSNQQDAYVPWLSGQVAILCSQGGGNDCMQTTWKASYTIDLPPNTTRNFTITGFRPVCPNYNSQGQVSLVANTDSGPAPSLLTPEFSSVVALSTGQGIPYVQLSWGPAQSGEQVKVYRSSERWGLTTDLTTSPPFFDSDGWVFRATDDLANKPSGVYYYGADLDLYNLVGNCNRYVKTGQVGLLLNYKPWIQTTGGDVHSNTRINTPGGP